MIKDRIYVLVGPTASGKTAAAIGIAKLINARLGRTAEIVSVAGEIWKSECSV